MKSEKIENMIKGWFVGDFCPVAHKSNACEVAVKTYLAGDKEDAHYHKVATEITLIIEGRVMMVGKEWGPGDIIVLEPGEVTAFEALTDSKNVVVKVPGALDDKYIV